MHRNREKSRQVWVRTPSEARACVFSRLGGVGQEVWSQSTPHITVVRWRSTAGCAATFRRHPTTESRSRETFSRGVARPRSREQLRSRLGSPRWRAAPGRANLVGVVVHLGCHEVQALGLHPLGIVFIGRHRGIHTGRLETSRQGDVGLDIAPGTGAQDHHPRESPFGLASRRSAPEL